MLNQSCFDQARAAALSVLKARLSTGEIANQAILDLNPAGGPVWQSGAQRITIQRGRWWPDGPPDNMQWRSFIPTINSSQSTGRIPRRRLAGKQSGRAPVHGGKCALCGIEQTVDFNILNPLGRFEGTRSVGAYSTAGNVSDQVCVAPFAVPACALLDQQGLYEKRTACVTERFFTESDRYRSRAGMPSGENPVPGAFWTPRFGGSAALEARPSMTCR